MKAYTVIYEKGDNGWGAWLPDLPGCIATGKTQEEVGSRIAEAARIHLASLREDGDEVPERVHYAGTVEVEFRG